MPVPNCSGQVITHTCYFEFFVLRKEFYFQVVGSIAPHHWRKRNFFVPFCYSAFFLPVVFRQRPRLNNFSLRFWHIFDAFPILEIFWGECGRSTWGPECSPASWSCPQTPWWRRHLQSVMCRDWGRLVPQHVSEKAFRPELNADPSS